MTPICHLTQYTAVVSELTGRTVYINDAANQFLVSPDIELDKVANVALLWLAKVESTQPEHRPPPGMRKAVASLVDCISREDVALSLQDILIKEFDAKRVKTSVMRHQRFLVELMLRLWSCGAVAWPTANQSPFLKLLLTLDTPGVENHRSGFLGKIRAYLDRGTDDSANFRFILDHLLARAGVREIGDLTPTTFYLTVERTRQGKLRSLGIQAVLNVLREEYHETAIGWTPENFGFFLAKMGHLSRDKNFTWLISKDPSMAHWATLAMEHLEANPANFRKRKSSVNNFLKHHLEHPELPRNPVEYFDIQRRPTAIYLKPGKSGRQTMAVVHEFLSEVLFKVCAQPNDNEEPILMPGFVNPVPKPKYSGVNKGETHREAMPTRLINLAMKILTDNDFAWAKEVGRLTDTFRWQNPESGEFETVWSPVRAYAVLVKLLLPARGYQVRMLDSGEGDSFRYQADGAWIPNTTVHSPPKTNKSVECGVFRQYQRQDGSKGAFFYFNTNKTADIDSIVKGYLMPWEKKDALDILVDLRNWQEKYNPVKGPAAWIDLIEHKSNKHHDDLAKMGSSFFLFRDPANGSRPDQPLTDPRLRSLWMKLMDEMERRLAAAGDTLRNGDPIRLVLTRDKQGQPTTVTFDLHSLRVSIITAMYEEGVPPEILMKIVGHATVMMTLYYIKLNAENISLRMDEAMLARQRKQQGEMVGFIKRTSRQELESAVAFRHPSGLDAAASATGAGFVVMDHGICPVATKRCHEGLAVLDPATKVTRYQAVPGGATNCSRCRFFLTSPAFLFGLEASCNDLTYRLKHASHLYERAQSKFDELADAYAASLSGGGSFNRQRDLEIAETAFEASRARTDEIALSLQASYGLTEQCIRISNENTGDGLALVAVGGTGHLEALLSEGHEFEQLSRICVNATLFDGLNIDWQQPNLERARLFDRMLRNSGHEARFSVLNDEDGLKVANEMSKFLYERLRVNDVHALVDGRTTLRAVGLEKAFVDQLEHIEPKTMNLARPSRILEEHE